MWILKTLENKLLRGVCFADGDNSSHPGASSGDAGGGAGGNGAGGAAPAATGEAAPAPSPQTPVQVQPSEVSGETTDDDEGMQEFGGFPSDPANDFDEITLPAEPAQAPPKVPATPAPAQQQPAPAVPQATAPQATSQQQQAPAPQVPPAAQEPPDPTRLEDFQRGIFEHQAALVQHLAATEFALTDQEKQALDTDAVSAIPAIMARTHLAAVVAATQNIHKIVPALVDKVLSRKLKSDEADKAFYDQWKQLDKAKHSPRVAAYAKLFRAANPQASREQAIQAVGMMVCGELGIPVNPALAAALPNGNGQQAPAAQATQRAAPFAPAKPGTSAPVTTIIEESPFAGMGRDYDD